MKKTFLTIFMAILMVAAVSLAEDLLLDAAWSLIPEEARMVEREQEDGLYAFGFRSDEAQYEVVMEADGSPVALQTEYSGVKGGESAVLDEAAVSSAVLAHAGEGAAIDYAMLKKSDKRYVWTVFAVKDADLLEYEVNAENGAICETDVYYGVSGGVLPSAVLTKIRSDKGDIVLDDIELELDDGQLICKGEAMLDGVKYEFEALTTDGTLTEWKRD